MRKHISILWPMLVICIVLAVTASAHPGGHGQQTDGELRVWTNVVTGETVKASFLFAREDRIYVERADGKSLSFPLRELAGTDRQFAEAQIARIQTANQQLLRRAEQFTSQTSSASEYLLLVLSAAVFAMITALWFRRLSSAERIRFAAAVALLLIGVCSIAVRQHAQTNRPSAAALFDAFAPKVRTRWDDKWLYVESNGIPDHPLMAGIKTWQQQVPVAQPYHGSNAWSIPLNPVPAAQPISAKTALFTGAIALAANGVPIFNALNNRGVDSFSIGELDDFGGHCGRADDYHYHAAPLHLQSKLGASSPIGYALDGYPLYGVKEPNGDTVTGLDDFNGHTNATTNGGKYHYHSTLTYPYINGGMHGQVTVSNDQIVPQPRAYSVRPATTPLAGASITAWRANSATSWTLEYQINGQTYKVNYSTDGAGHYTYEFVDPAGNKRTENYTRRGMVSSVSAASYNGTALAAESIGAMFGTGLSNATRIANSTPLPTSLNGTSINVVDSLGLARLSPLFFVSPGQVNYQIPAGTAPGAASISLNINDVFTGFGELNIATVAPGLFTADASGQGYPAAVAYRYRGTTLVAVESLTQLDATNKVIAKPLDLGPETDSIFLVLFGTGLRFRSSLSGVTATIGGAPAEVLFVGAQTDFVGMDQINVRVPRSLANTTGDVNVVLAVDGKTANAVKINLKSAASSAIAWSMLKLPDTGQTGHFGNAFGEDSDYTINAPAFTTNNDGTLTDNVTGLQWQQGDGGEMTWDNARSYCDGLTLAGKDDWRLPGLHESFSVLNHNTVNPAIATAFTRTQAEYWWAAELRSDDTARAWATNAGGGSGPHPKTETVSGGGTKRFHARCVRDTGAGLSLTAIYKDNSNGTVTDNRTNLTWQQTDVADKTWDEAITYCEGLTLAGASDWRLPNIKELTSINDESRVRPSLNLTAFPNAASALSWASTTQVNQTTRAWTVDFTLGISSQNAKTDKLR
ncbi:MAG TPA: DUF1566 domain-containing protein, partial [Blastocatellia bacterium]|nr:DUF1566 domain-containing protein [Blastocatellia bacterium]HMZ18704.1 DUF1566 domain-containing protein [Blastocatellia bacterium]